MEIAGVKIGGINAGNAGNLDLKYKEMKKNKIGASTTVSATGAVIDEKAKAKAMPKLTAKDLEALRRKAVQTSGVADPPTEKQSAKAPTKSETDEKMWHIECIVNYKTHPNTRSIPGVQGVYVPKITDNIEICRASHAQVKRLLNKSGAETIIRGLVDLVPVAAEKVTMDMGYNPLELDLRGFGSAWQQIGDDKDFLEPEMTELVIEWQSTFAQPCWVRVLKKFYDVATKYSARQKGLVSQNASSVRASSRLRDMGDNL